MNDLSLYERVSPLEKNFPVKFSVCRGGFHLHWHEHLEFLYCIRKGKVFCSNRTYNLNARELIVVNSKEYHSTHDGYFYCMRVTPSFFSDIEFDNVLFVPHIKNDETINNCFKMLRKETKLASPGYDMAVKSIVYHFMCHLLRNYKTDTISDTDSSANKSSAVKTGEILTYITKNCHEKLSTASIAEHFHLSESYFCYLFKSQTGMSLINYVNKFRVEKAAVLLKNTGQSITDIALSVGFDDSNYFSRIFKKYMDMSPMEYKKNAVG